MVLLGRHGAQGCRKVLSVTRSVVKKAGVALVATSAVVAMAACSDRNGSQGSGKAEPQFGYALPQELVTTNAGTALGVATDATKISARLYPGAFIEGPDGQLLPNPDLVTATPSPKSNGVVNYQIANKAKYSDGKPVVCDDFLLTYKASQRPDLFGSDIPLFSQVENVNCSPGAKRFTVTFKKGFGDRYRELFAAGTVLPLHAVAERAQVSDGPKALRSEDPNALTELGRQWQESFLLSKTDPVTVPTSGPYKIAQRTDDGHLELAVNEGWAGVKPTVETLHVWPRRADLAQLRENNQLKVADVDAGRNLEELGLKEPDWRVTKVQSSRVDTLRISDLGSLSTPELRQALNQCIDQRAMAQDVTKHSGARVRPVGLRAISPAHPLASQLNRTAAKNTAFDPEKAGALAGQKVRIGYLETTSRYKIIVEQIKKTCGAVGVNVEPVPLKVSDYGTLGVDYDALLDTRTTFGRNAAVAGGVSGRLTEIQREEQKLAEESFSIPLVAEARTIAFESHVHNVLDNGADGGVSWNMDRWITRKNPVPAEAPSASDPDAKNSGTAPAPQGGEGTPDSKNNPAKGR